MCSNDPFFCFCVRHVSNKIWILPHVIMQCGRGQRSFFRCCCPNIVITWFTCSWSLLQFFSFLGGGGGGGGVEERVWGQGLSQQSSYCYARLQSEWYGLWSMWWIKHNFHLSVRLILFTVQWPCSACVWSCLQITYDHRLVKVELCLSGGKIYKMGPFTRLPGQVLHSARLRLGAGCYLKQTWIWSLTSISLKTRHLSACYTSTPKICVPDNRWRNNGMRAAFSPTPEPYSQLSFRKSLYPQMAWFGNSLQVIMGLTSDFAVLPLSCVEIFCLWLNFLYTVCNKHYVRDIRHEKEVFGHIIFVGRVFVAGTKRTGNCFTQWMKKITKLLTLPLYVRLCLASCEIDSGVHLKIPSEQRLVFEALHWKNVV